MKKQSLISAILFGLGVSLSAMASAQGSNSPVNPFEKGVITFSAGIGVGTEYNSNYYNTALGSKVVVEKGMWQAGPGVISLGAEVGGSFSSGGALQNYKANTVALAGRSAWHNGWNVTGLDTYAGLAVGLGFKRYSYYKDGNIRQNEVIPVFGGFIGASYYFTPTFGVNVELGNDITTVQGGIVVKIR